MLSEGCNFVSDGVCIKLAGPLLTVFPSLSTYLSTYRIFSFETDENEQDVRHFQNFKCLVIGRFAAS